MDPAARPTSSARGWTLNVQLMISKVYLKKHTSMTYTLNKKDSKMVGSMKKKKL